MSDYFTAGPVNTGGIYEQRRSGWDGFLGTLDGLASATNSVGNTVGGIADIREDWARGQQAYDDVRLNREAAELDMLLDRVKVDRGDNVQLYYAGAALAVGALWLLR